MVAALGQPAEPVVVLVVEVGDDRTSLFYDQRPRRNRNFAADQTDTTDFWFVSTDSWPFGMINNKT